MPTQMNGIYRTWIFNNFPFLSKRKMSNASISQFLLIMVSEAKMTLLVVYTAYSLNLLAKTSIRCTLRINIFWDLKERWSPKIEKTTIENSLFHFSVVMTQLWFMKLLIRTQVYGEVNSWREPFTIIPLTTSNILNLIFRSEKLFSLVFTVSNCLELMNILISIWNRNQKFSEKLMLNKFFSVFTSSLRNSHHTINSWSNSSSWLINKARV